jgi:FMN reductase
MDKRIVGISGNFSRPSRTRTLTQAVVEETTRRGGWTAEVFDMVDAMPGLATAKSMKDASTELSRIWSAIEQCDALVVGSPVYKASYAGLLKHLFDLMDMRALKSRPVAVVATGKAAEHALMIEHQFKPLFGFFNAYVVPTAIYAVDSGFTAEGEVAESLASEIERLVDDLCYASAR